jgi:hypothetical protein
MDKIYKCSVKFNTNNNNAIYKIQTNIQIFKCFKDENNIKLLLPNKQDFINFEFDTLDEDIYINIEIDEIRYKIDDRMNLRLNHLPDKYKRRISHKIKWDLNKDKRKILIKSFIINKDKYPEIYKDLEKYAPIYQ